MKLDTFHLKLIVQFTLASLYEMCFIFKNSKFNLNLVTYFNFIHTISVLQ